MVNTEPAGSAPPESDAELVARLKRFYNADSLHDLIRKQNEHVEKLQSSYTTQGLPAFNKVRV